MIGLGVAAYVGLGLLPRLPSPAAILRRSLTGRNGAGPALLLTALSSNGGRKALSGRRG